MLIDNHSNCKVFSNPNLLKSISEVKNIIAQTSNNKFNIGYKFGLEFLYSKNGRDFISKINL